VLGAFGLGGGVAADSEGRQGIAAVAHRLAHVGSRRLTGYVVRRGEARAQRAKKPAAAGAGRAIRGAWAYFARV
jgi:hypothetical protein